MSFGKNPWKRTKLDSVCDAVEGYDRVRNMVYPRGETKQTPQQVNAPTPKRAPGSEGLVRVKNMVYPK